MAGTGSMMETSTSSRMENTSTAIQQQNVISEVEETLGPQPVTKLEVTCATRDTVTMTTS